VANYGDALAIDMESYGVARAVHEARSDPGYNPRLLVIRGVSDLVHAAPEGEDGDDDTAEVNNDERARWKNYAAASAAAFAAATISEYLST